MDSYKEYNPQPIALFAQDLDGLKKELGQQLARLTQRRPKDISIVSTKIPLGIAGTVSKDSPFFCLVPISLSGTIGDMFTYLMEGAKGVTVQIDIYGKEKLPAISKIDLPSGLRELSLSFAVTAKSVIAIKVESQTEEAVTFAVGLSFKEVHPYEIKKNQLDGLAQGGAIAN